MSNNIREIKYITGLRPSANLTLANYIGAIKSLLEVQKSNNNIMIFVADLHGLTDQEPEIISKYHKEVVMDYLASGIDPKKSIIFIQSCIAPQLGELTLYLSRLITVAELMRVPALKDKLKNNKKPENANSLLLLYPVLMASDILIQKVKEVPVGEDQLAHLEVTRKLAKRFNTKYGKVFTIPKAHQIEAVKILSLKGQEKMSKTSPNDAIFLTDSIESAAKKIKKAQTAPEGIMNDNLKSLVILAKNLCDDKSKIKSIDKLINRHKNKEQVMGEFKALLTEIVTQFLSDFQKKRDKIKNQQSLVNDVLEKGKKIAVANADHTLNKVRKLLFKHS